MGIPVEQLSEAAAMVDVDHRTGRNGDADAQHRLGNDGIGRGALLAAEPAHRGQHLPELTPPHPDLVGSTVREDLQWHVKAQKVGVILDHGWEGNACRVKALIEDDGVGFEPEVVVGRGRLGLFGLQERAEILGGTLAVESSPGNGTTIYVEIPCDHQSPHRG